MLGLYICLIATGVAFVWALAIAVRERERRIEAERKVKFHQQQAVKYYVDWLDLKHEREDS